MDFAFALIAAFSWAASAPVISRALKRTKASATPRLGAELGLVTALAAGALGTTLTRGTIPLDAMARTDVALAGIFTFSVGTGLYYLSATAFSQNAGVAAQFSNVKPVFSIFFGIALFNEAVTPLERAGVAAIVAGVAVLVAGMLARHIRPLPVLLGLSLAAAWSLGEVFVKIAGADVAAPSLTQAALLDAFLLSLVVLLLRHRPAALAGFARAHTKVLALFAVHGILSFSVAYGFFFTSIGRIGLAATISLTTFWPGLALLVNSALEKGSFARIPRPVLAAMALMMLGSALALAGRIQG